MPTLFEPLTVGKLELPSRILMAPMTRSRATEAGLVTEQTALYYAQRASAGLIITEGTQPNVVGQGYITTPGLHDKEQVEAWRKVTDAVHEEGGRIFVQLMHTGRVGHPDLLPDGLVPVAPSAVRGEGGTYTGGGMLSWVEPHALTGEEIAETIAAFADAARNAIEAGFDGVELHGANGYLLHQFLADNTNLRTDEYGAKIRFVVEAVTAVAAAIGPERTALRISPGNPYNDMSEADPASVYPALLQALAPLGLAYLHIMEVQRDFTKVLRSEWPGVLVLNPAKAPGKHGAQEANEVMAEGLADAVAFGELFLANPDLPARLAAEGPYNVPDPATYFGGGERGYLDYPRI